MTALVSNSCEKFLTEEPRTSLPPSGVYGTEAGAESAMTGLYQRLSYSNTQHAFSTFLGYASKTHIWKGTQTTSEYEQCHYATLYAASSQNSTIFNSHYIAVNACNAVLEGIKESPLSEEFKTEIEAETRFVRAYTYFNILRLWGDAPLVTEQPSGLEATFVKRTPYQEIVKFIIEEMDYAEKYMRSKEKQDAANPDGGRCYREAATATKVGAYVWIASMMEDTEDQFYDQTKEGRSPLNHPVLKSIGLNTAKDAWEAALKEAEKLIDNPSCPYALEPDFRNLFRWDPENHPEDYRSRERIIVGQNSNTADANNIYVPWTLWKHPYGSKSMTGSHSTAGKTRPAAWVWQKWNEIHGNTKFCSKNSAIRTASDDPRLKATYEFTQAVSWDEKNYGKTTTLKNMFPNYSSLRTGTTGNGSYHFFRKYYSPTFNTDGGCADTYILRMADIYLWAAEACAYLDREEDALRYVNAILKRARESVDAPSSPAVQPADWTPGQFGSKMGLVNAIMMEHLFERHGENQEYFDLRRHGAAWFVENVVFPMNRIIHLSCMEAVLDGLYCFGCDTPSDPDFIRKVMMLPYPHHELVTNMALTEEDQNDFFYQ